MTKQFVVGEPNSPVSGQTKFTAEFLKQCFVNFIMIDDVPFNQLQPDAQFTHNYLQGIIDISPQSFEVGSHIICDITPVKPCFC